MNAEQARVYNSFLKRIGATIEDTISNVDNSMVDKMKDTLYNNGEIWKSIQSDMMLPRYFGHQEKVISYAWRCPYGNTSPEI